MATEGGSGRGLGAMGGMLVRRVQSRKRIETQIWENI
jgi:hypothetical protein